MVNRRHLFRAAIAATPTLGVISCGGSDECDEVFAGLSLLDSARMDSWELCGAKRSGGVDAERDVFWSDREFGGLPILKKHVLLGADPSGQRLLIREQGSDGSSTLRICEIEGAIVAEFPLRLGGYVSRIQMGGDNSLVALVDHMGERKEPSGIYVWAGGPEGWQLATPVKTGAGHLDEMRGMTTSKDGVIWSEGGVIRMCRFDGSDRREVGEGEFPSLSPSGRHLYVRDVRSKCARIYEWPTMKSHIVYAGPVLGRLAVWDPVGRCVVVEHQRIGLRLRALVVKSGSAVDLGMIRSWGSVENCISFVRWGKLGPKQLKEFGYKKRATMIVE